MRNDAHVQAVQAIYAAFVTGDVPAILEHLQPDVAWIHVGAPELPYGQTYHGREEVARFFGDLAAVLDFTAFEATAFISEGDEVVALGHYDATARATGNSAHDDWAMRWTFRDGKVARYQAFVDTLSGAKNLGTVVSAVPATA